MNIASHMESSGDVDRVNISEATYAPVREWTGTSASLGVPAFSFTPRGQVSTKGKGELRGCVVRQS